MSTVKVDFSGSVVDVTVALDGDPVDLAPNETADKWSGETDVPAGQPKIVDMIIIAPRFTDWALVVKVESTKVVDDDGTTDRDPFAKTWRLRPAAKEEANG